MDLPRLWNSQFGSRQVDLVIPTWLSGISFCSGICCLARLSPFVHTSMACTLLQNLPADVLELFGSLPLLFLNRQMSQTVELSEEFTK